MVLVDNLMMVRDKPYVFGAVPQNQKSYSPGQLSCMAMFDLVYNEANLRKRKFAVAWNHKEASCNGGTKLEGQNGEAPFKMPLNNHV